MMSTIVAGQPGNAREPVHPGGRVLGPLQHLPEHGGQRALDVDAGGLRGEPIEVLLSESCLGLLLGEHWGPVGREGRGPLPGVCDGARGGAGRGQDGALRERSPDRGLPFEGPKERCRARPPC
eukprot:1681256-Pyramimonas_sp.AAC.1